MTPRRTDVLVVGAGPAGAATAAALGRRGMDVLLVGAATCAATGYDTALGAPAVHALTTLDATIGDHLRPVSVVELRFGQDEPRTIAAGAAACDRGRLLSRLRRLAVAEGAEFISGRVIASEPLGGRGHKATIDAPGGGATVVARHVVVAAGADSRDVLAPRRAPHAAGVACARRFAGVGWDSRMLVHPVPPSNTDPRDYPRCIWVVPGDAGACTVGVAVVGGRAAVNAEDLLDAALATLAAYDPRFAAAEPLGTLASGPVNSGFAPELAVQAQSLLVGDAAGLVNPFTGEGMSHAIMSGSLAADSIAAHPADPAAARTRYRRQLASTFVGYFETARHAARRYHLAWRVLAGTAHSDHPFFALGRRAMLLPDNLTGMAPEAALSRGDELYIRPFLAACDEIAIAAVRREWPFLARLLITDARHTPRLRPATLFLAALISGGAVPRAEHAAVGAAMDLAALGALAFLGPVRPVGRPGRDVDWETAVVVLACDFLLSQAARLVAESAPEASWAFSDWLAELSALRAARLTGTPAVGTADLFASLFEFPARVGAQLGGALRDVVQHARDFGHHCGRAFILAEDVLALGRQPTRLGTTTEVLLKGQASTIPDLLPEHEITADRLRTDPGVRSAALAAALAECRHSLRLARTAAAGVSEPTSSRILRALAATIEPSVSPARPAGVTPGEDAWKELLHETHDHY